MVNTIYAIEKKTDEENEKKIIKSVGNLKPKKNYTKKKSRKEENNFMDGGNKIHFTMLLTFGR